MVITGNTGKSLSASDDGIGRSCYYTVVTACLCHFESEFTRKVRLLPTRMLRSERQRLEVTWERIQDRGYKSVNKRHIATRTD